MVVNINVAVSDTHWRLLAKIQRKFNLRNQAQTIEKCLEITAKEILKEEAQ